MIKLVLLCCCRSVSESTTLGLWAKKKKKEGKPRMAVLSAISSKRQKARDLTTDVTVTQQGLAGTHVCLQTVLLSVRWTAEA